MEKILFFTGFSKYLDIVKLFPRLDQMDLGM